MSDTATIAPEEAPEHTPSTRTVRRRRGLPGGRAVVGAFLVTVAAVGVFGAYLSATAEPATRYAVAARDIAPGTRLTGQEFSYVALDLPEAQAAGAVSEAQAPQVPGFTTVGPVRAGDLLLSSLLIDDRGADQRYTMSFSVPDERALAGKVGVGEVVDVVATYPGTAGRAYTDIVVRGAEVLELAERAGQLGQTTQTFLVALTDLVAVQRLAHAIDTAEVFIVRPGTGADDPVPAPYRPTGPDGADASGSVVPAPSAPSPGPEG